ncbi:MULTISPECIES: hypothetical protein [unclassified Streptomyces]|uniref:hypothetical protein n=1 Tax=unclassified Streptomyces TaxID=2593676 RepID=UPI0006FC7956|nr:MULTISPECIES: hypothetical protein [unclassified Streptomyces]KQX59426.1 hypothetical protein ASD33_03875 [Streptomyces sp. Root1304]KRB00686.1 hypothetical protein ASE09_03875 [Streptomyces sp. Root66D1]
MRTSTHTPPVHPSRPVSESEAARVFQDLKAAMDSVGLPTSGLYRDVTHSPGGDVHRYGLGVVSLLGAERLTVLLRDARATP